MSSAARLMNVRLLHLRISKISQDYMRNLDGKILAGNLPKGLDQAGIPVNGSSPFGISGHVVTGETYVTRPWMFGYVRMDSKRKYLSGRHFKEEKIFSERHTYLPLSL